MKGADQCPRCASRRWATLVAPSDFYADELRVCRNCKTVWEPFEESELLDPKREPLGAFKHPCGNCAFRKGSPEQRGERLAEIREQTGWGKGSFYCHKGVPISPSSENGFDYPENGTNPLKLRLCRGYLNQLPRTPNFAAPETTDWKDS